MADLSENQNSEHIVQLYGASGSCALLPKKNHFPSILVSNHQIKQSFKKHHYKLAFF
jgi:hypothetical protein